MEDHIEIILGIDGSLRTFDRRTGELHEIKDANERDQVLCAKRQRHLCRMSVMDIEKCILTPDQMRRWMAVDKA